ncbi:ImmA/IrrE family metallo-endopeptidase [Lachnotalea glycerini]|uniref:ImmA/IrrE family metallo-endopeptidase n=1 Tax=Lachnotalea glycerini TaxID=1763509 RepID=A0A371JC94_9FIRM|nr:ImmA/IrrE family metallo-endopeptidase [Lachnotalea glycerini]RDY30371.1 ImmA/IrrE family metallo-endopeptidase [Lachnotalea glycerini]
MNYDFIKLKVLDVYKTCNVQSFPIDCFEIYERYDLKAHPYSTLKEPLKSYCYNMSDDSFIYEHTICFNDDDSYPIGRIRFSLMHELGHHVLKHSTNRTESEEIEANTFASHILAPRLVIHYADCKNCNDVASIFDLSIEAASIAFDDYRKWRRKFAAHKLSCADKLTYYYFYDSNQDLFIWKQTVCPACGKTAYNTLDNICSKCSHVTKQIKVIEKLSYMRTSNENLLQDENFKKAERNWLYGDCY